KLFRLTIDVTVPPLTRPCGRKEDMLGCITGEISYKTLGVFLWNVFCNLQRNREFKLPNLVNLRQVPDLDFVFQNWINESEGVLRSFNTKDSTASLQNVLQEKAIAASEIADACWLKCRINEIG